VSEPGRALFEQLAAVTDAMVFVTDMEANSLWINQTLVQMTGYSLEDYRFQRFENPFIPAEDTAKVGEFLGSFLASNATVSGIVRNRFVDRWGGTMHVRSRITKISWEGQPALLYVTAREDEPSLEAEQRYRSLVEAATDAIVRLRPDLTVHFSNRCFQDLVGRDPVELNTRSFADLVVESHREAVRAQLRSDEVRFQFSAPLRATDGSTVWLEGTFVRITRGADAGLLQAILRDTTQKRRLDARVQRAQKEQTLGQMAGGIAHDLNNILTAILGSASLAERHLPIDDLAGDALSDIRIAARRAGELSSSMLAYAGEGNVERLPVDICDLVTEMKPLLASGLAKNVELVVEAPPSPVLVLADEIQLRQVVMNLITNAADATPPEGGAVVVQAGTREVMPADERAEHIFGTALAAGRVAFVRVRDRGVGMSADVVARIFDPFYSSKARGRGLGLAAVLGILGRHDGCVRVTSSEGEGTEMEILLPLTKGSSSRETQNRRAPAATGEGTVLVVDDEALLRRLVRRTLEPVGYDVIEAACGEDALEQLAKPALRVDAVVLDQTMPGMSGERTLVEIRRRFPSMPVVRTSGYAADPSSKRRDDHTFFLGKPYSADELVDVMQRALAADQDA
jgi:two-component system, cell cycle sensor histidine kinase and response regulator CckA